MHNAGLPTTTDWSDTLAQVLEKLSGVTTGVLRDLTQLSSTEPPLTGGTKEILAMAALVVDPTRVQIWSDDAAPEHDPMPASLAPTQQAQVLRLLCTLLRGALSHLPADVVLRPSRVCLVGLDSPAECLCYDSPALAAIAP